MEFGTEIPYACDKGGVLMAKTFNVKPSPSAIGVKAFQGKKGSTYIVMKTGNEFHVFVEVEAKEAASDCGCNLSHKGHSPTQMWMQLWKK